MDFFGFTLFGVYLGSWIIVFMFSSKFGVLLAITSLNTFLAPHSFLEFPWYDCYLFFTVPEISEALLVLASVDCSSHSHVDFLDCGMMSDF